MIFELDFMVGYGTVKFPGKKTSRKMTANEVEKIKIIARELQRQGKSLHSKMQGEHNLKTLRIRVTEIEIFN